MERGWNEQIKAALCASMPAHHSIRSALPLAMPAFARSMALR
jgi:hypothetical protein